MLLEHLFFSVVIEKVNMFGAIYFMKVWNVKQSVAFLLIEDLYLKFNL